MGNAVDYLRGAGALGVIIFALGIKNFSATLGHSIFVWLGRISYSLYLLHIPILYVLRQTIGESWGVLETSIVLIVLSLLFAEMSARWVEEPFIRLGKKLSALGIVSRIAKPMRDCWRKTKRN